MLSPHLFLTTYLADLRERDSYFPFLDGLRSISVLAVIIYHLLPLFIPSGFLGVDIFFLLSGFVISIRLPILFHPSKPISSNYIFFLLARIKRIWPALLVLVALVVVFFSFITPFTAIITRTGSTALIGIPNLYLYKNSVDYFSSLSQYNPLLHTWSLGIEAQFYLFVSSVYFLSAYFKRIYHTRVPINSLFIFATFTLSFLLFIYKSRSDFAQVYFLPQYRLWELCLGSLLFQLCQALRHHSLLLKIPACSFSRIASVVLLSVVFTCLFMPANLYFVTIPTVLISVSILIASSLITPNIVSEFISTPPFLIIGVLSYSLYLYHWPLIVFIRSTVGFSPLSFLIWLALLLVLSYLSFAIVETGFCFSYLQKISSIQVSVYLSILPAISLYIASLFTNFLYLGRHVFMGVNYDSRTPCKASDFLSKKKNFEECGFKSHSFSKTIYLLGDSHGQQFYEPLSEFSSKNSFNLVSVWSNGCPFPSAFSFTKERTLPCTEAQHRVKQKLLSSVTAGDVVVFGSALTHYFNPSNLSVSKLYDLNGNAISQHQALSLYKDSFLDLTTRLKQKGVKSILLMSDITFPSLQSPAYYCRHEWFRPIRILDRSCSISKDSALTLLHKVYGWVDSWHDSKLNYSWNPHDYNPSCDEIRCLASFYQDNNHYSKSLSSYLFKRSFPLLERE